MVNPSGYTALDLIGFTDRGDYDATATYVKNDIVHYSSNTYRCLIDDTTAVTPVEGLNWTLFIGEPSNLVEAIVAPVETAEATMAHSVGDQLIYNDVLYKVIAPIAIDDALVINTNIQVTRKVVYQISAVESVIAPIEYSSTASQAYAVGDYILYSWNLYKVIAAIAQGDSYTVNTNIEQTKLSDVIKSIIRYVGKKLTATLTTGNTTLTFTDSSITNTALIDVYTSDASVFPKTQSVSSTTLTLTFKAQSVNVDVAVIVKER